MPRVARPRGHSVPAWHLRRRAHVSRFADRTMPPAVGPRGSGKRTCAVLSSQAKAGLCPRSTKLLSATDGIGLRSAEETLQIQTRCPALGSCMPYDLLYTLPEGGELRAMPAARVSLQEQIACAAWKLPRRSPRRRSRRSSQSSQSYGTPSRTQARSTWGQDQRHRARGLRDAQPSMPQMQRCNPSVAVRTIE